jgi:putative endonuclease
LQPETERNFCRAYSSPDRYREVRATDSKNDIFLITKTMDACCYILFSYSLNKFYIGASHHNPEIRLQKHNLAYYGNSKFTAAATDWKLILVIQAIDFSHALRIEKHIKKMKSRRFIENLIKHPDMVEKIIHLTNN